MGRGRGGDTSRADPSDACRSYASVSLTIADIPHPRPAGLSDAGQSHRQQPLAHTSVTRIRNCQQIPCPPHLISLVFPCNSLSSLTCLIARGVHRRNAGETPSRSLTSSLGSWVSSRTSGSIVLIARFKGNEVTFESFPDSESDPFPHVHTPHHPWIYGLRDIKRRES